MPLRAGVGEACDRSCQRHGDPRRRWSAPGGPPRGCRADDDCPATLRFHCCCGPCRSRSGCRLPCDENSTGAPEAAGACVAGTCAPITAKTHAFDVAARSYLLPLALAHATGRDAARLRALVADHRAADPDRRPSLGEALARLQEPP